jgi:hypothetical protein
MPDGEPPHLGAGPSIFISYASQDRDAARNLRDALEHAGFEVWYDESELGGGDAWDQKIRRQIRECRYFMPVISANANARHEGYFRREWRLAVERSLDMADDVTFIVPVSVDGSSQEGARVPDKFVSVQWLSLPGGNPTAGFDAWCRRLLGHEPAPAQAPRKRHGLGRQEAAAPAAAPGYPVFPEQKPGQKLHFLFLVVGWLLRTAWVWYLRLSPGPRRLVILLLIFLLLGKMCSSRDGSHEPTAQQKAKAKEIMSGLGQKFDTAAQTKEGKVDLVKLGTEIADAVNREVGDNSGADPDVLAVPFSSPASDEVSGRFAGTVFASAYGQISMAEPGRVALAKAEGAASAAPLQLAKDRDAKKVLFGAVQGNPSSQSLEVTLLQVDEEKVLWTGSYPLKGADPMAVADDIRSHVQAEK